MESLKFLKEDIEEKSKARIDDSKSLEFYLSY